MHKPILQLYTAHLWCSNAKLKKLQVVAFIMRHLNSMYKFMYHLTNAVCSEKCSGICLKTILQGALSAQGRYVLIKKHNVQQHPGAFYLSIASVPRLTFSKCMYFESCGFVNWVTVFLKINTKLN